MRAAQQLLEADKRPTAGGMLATSQRFALRLMLAFIWGRLQLKHVFDGHRGVDVGLMIAVLLAGLQPQPESAQPAFVRELIAAAVAQASELVVYDGSYRRISYPGGDVPAHIGVCTDVIIRAYRAVGIDLQQRVHEDMSHAFSSYPKIWGLSRPDPNIDHRRVPNLQTYFRRRGAQRAVALDPRSYLPGDLVTWMLPGNLPHIGLAPTDVQATGYGR